MGEDAPPETNENEEDIADVEAQASLLLRAKNIKEFHSVLSTAGSLTFPNGVAIDSGVVVTFKNKGLFDGNWIVQKYTIRLVGGKLESEIEFRKCLDFSTSKVTHVYRLIQPSADDSEASTAENVPEK